MRLKLEQLPCSINAIALGNVGVAIIWRNLGMKGLFHFDSIDGIVYAFTLISLLLHSLYILRCLFFFAKFLADASKPPTIAALGAFSMTLSLLGSILTVPSLYVPVDVPITIVLIAATLQLLFMLRFLYIANHQKKRPEPYWYAAMLSCVFPAITLPGDALYCIVIRKFFIALGLALILLILPTLLYRTLSRYTGDKEEVANNPSVCLTQAGTSIICSGWCVTPLVGTIDDGGPGEMIGHVMFAISTTGFILTLVALYQRRKTLLALGASDTWASATFPFCNTAIAAGLYLTAHFEPWNALSTWSLVLSLLASLITIAVDILFLCNGLFMLVRLEKIAPAAPAQSDANIEVVHWTRVQL